MSGPPTVPRFSDDGRWWWDGARWRPAVSEDGRWRWDGTRWRPAAGGGGQTRGGDVQPPAPAHRSQGGGRSVVPILAPILGGVVVVVLAVVYLLAGLSAARGEETSRQATIARVLSQQAGVLDAISTDPVFSLRSADAGVARAAFAQFKARLDGTRQVLATDQTDLGRLDQKQAPGWLTVPWQPGLDRERLRTRAVQAAVAAGLVIVQIREDEVAVFLPTFDALIELDTAAGTAQGNDIAGALSHLDSVRTKLQQGLDASRSADIPPQLGPILTDVTTLVNDFQTLLQAAQRGDAGAVNQALGQLNSDQAKLQTIDTQAIDAAETSIVQPHVDEYNHQLKAAGTPLIQALPGSTDSRRAHWGPGARAGGSAPRTRLSIAIAL